jgi:glycosyltransferase involved in cell wall biosynthesis
MKISIAMATYNGGQFLHAQLQSFVDQTRQPDELIITDDGSTDETETIARAFAKTVHFTVEIHRNEKNLGYCGNFNAALIKTTGDLVFLSDQDDVWFPEKIEHMAGVAQKNPKALVVMNDTALTDDELNEVGLTKIGQLRSAGLKMDSFVMGCCCAIRRELLDLCLPIPSGVKGHDNWLVWFANGLDAKVIDTPVLQYYRRHESNESQFIANRTTRVTRGRARLQSMKNIFNHDPSTKLQAQLEQFKVFADGVQDTMAKAPRHYRSQLLELEDLYRQRAAITEKRLSVIQRAFFPRVATVLSLLLGGEYRYANGLSSAVRDILSSSPSSN